MFSSLSFRALALSSTALVLSATLLSGCAAGPDFKVPEAPQVSSYTAGGYPLSTESAATSFGGAQRFQPGGDVPAAWWHLFQSPQLSRLMEQAIASSPTLEAASAALRAAEEKASAAYGGFFPSVTGSASDNRTKSGSSPSPFTLYNTSVSVSYAPDIFGAQRRTAESAEARALAQKFEVEAAYLTLTGNIVTTAVQEASLRAQIAATREIVKTQKKQLDIVQARFDAGATSKQTVLAQKATLAATEAGLPPLEKQLAQTRNLLTVLAGRFPSEDIGATFEMDSFKLPEELPLSLPSTLVEHRPDIRAALANLQAANADVGIATAAMLPQISLTGSYGIASGALSGMFGPGSAVWGLGAGLLQPIFKGGELLHSKRASEALFDQAAAQYRGTVLTAFQNVADSLKALESDATALKAQLAAERAAFENLELAAQQYNAGAIAFADLLTAQTSYQQAKILLIQAKARRLTDTAALFQSLGGGWWNKEQASKSN